LAWWQAFFLQFIRVVDMFCDSLRDIVALGTNTGGSGSQNFGVHCVVEDVVLVPVKATIG